jgi:hypothetical protein
MIRETKAGAVTIAQNGTEMRRDVGEGDDGAGGKEDADGAGVGDGDLGGRACGNEIVKVSPHLGHLADLPSALDGTANDEPQCVQLARFLSAVSAIASSTDAGSREAPED